MLKHLTDDLGCISSVFHDPGVAFAASTITTFDGVLKERYIESSKVEELVYPENVLMGLLEKRGDTGMVGAAMPIPIITKNPQGVSGGFSTAQAAATPIGTDQFLTTAGDYYGVVEIGDKVLMASRTNPGAFLENKVTEIDGLYETAMENLSLYSWGNGGQALGRIAQISTNDIVLTNPTDIGNFERDMTVVASSNDGSVSTHTLIDNGDSTTVSAVNRSLGALTLTSAAAISGLAVGDYLFRKGDFFGDQGVIVIRGVQAYITATDAPPALWGISAATRALDPQRYAGCRINAAELVGLSYEARLKKACAQMTSRFKSRPPTHFFVNPEDFDTLESNMAARGMRDLDVSETQFGYASIKVSTSSGKIPVFSDRHCPIGTAFGFRMDDWWISSMGELLHPQNSDGLTMLRRDSSTDLEFRLIAYPILANRAPKNQVRVPLS